MKADQDFSEVIWESFPGGGVFDQLFKGYFLELAERKRRVFQVVGEGMVWGQEDVESCLSAKGPWQGWCPRVSERRMGLGKS